MEGHAIYVGMQTADVSGLTPYETLQHCKAVDAQIFEWVFFWKAPLSPDDAMARQVARRAHEAGIILQIHGPAVGPAIGDPPFASTIDLALAIGADRITLHLEDLVSGFVPDWSRLNGTPCWIGVENTPQSGPDPDRLLAYLAGLRPEWQVGATFDLGHANMSPLGAAEYARRLIEGLRLIGRPLVNVHCHDNLGDADSHLVPGEGSVDFETIMPLLRDGGADRFVVERWEGHERSLAHLRSCLFPS